MQWLKANAPELLPLVIAVVVPLAGIILAANIWLTGDRRRGQRVAAATVLGIFLYALVFSL